MALGSNWNWEMLRFEEGGKPEDKNKTFLLKITDRAQKLLANQLAVLI